MHPMLAELTAATSDPKVIAALLRKVADEVETLDPLPNERPRRFSSTGTHRPEEGLAVLYRFHLEPHRI